MRSAWLKWARGVEHGKLLARATREYVATTDRFAYVRSDNARDAADPFVRMEWTLRTDQDYPERWSVLLSDLLSNFRAALDHSFWHAVVTHSGHPKNPTRVMFPICTTEADFRKRSTELQFLVNPDVWKVITAIQPLHGKELAHTHPLAILQWLSNRDKHRSMHVVSSTFVDMGPALLTSAVPLEVADQWVREGPATDGDVVARLRVRRPRSSLQIDITPTFAHTPTIQISEKPVEFRGLGSVINVMGEHVVKVLAAVTAQLGLGPPEPDSLELGADHDVVLPEAGGDLLIWSTPDGAREVHRLSQRPDGPAPS